MSVTQSASRSIGERSHIVPVHKPVGMTSRSVVDCIEERFSILKVGHGGTLDPMAEGVLPLHFNEATKVVEYLHETTKTYRVRCRFDLHSDSMDLGNDVHFVGSDASEPPKKEVREQLQSFQGSHLQIPPAYSAVKVDGKPLYDWARSSEKNLPAVEARRVQCHEIQLLHFNYPSLTFELSCGKGFYVRSLVRDLADALNQPGGIVTVLVRTQYGPYDLTSCAKLHEDPEHWKSAIHPVRSALETIPLRTCEPEEIQRITNGGRVVRTIMERDRAAAVDAKGRVHAVLEPVPDHPGSEWKPRRVLNRRTS